MKNKFGQGGQGVIPAPYTEQAPAAPGDAQAPAPAAPAPAPKPATPGGGRPQTGQAVPSSSSVAQMQKEILELYNAFRANSDVSEWFKKDKEPEAGSDEFRKGPYGFLQSLLNRYIDGSTQKANQYDLTMPDAKEYALPGKQLPRSSFLQYLNMLRIVGPHTSAEQVATPDGKWGEYTNNALKAAWSIGFAMASIADKLNIKDFPLKVEDMKEFSKLIPPDANFSDDIKNKYSKYITAFLKKIVAAAPAFINIMKNSAQGYGAYISGDKRFDVFSGTKQGLSPEEQKRAAEIGNSPVPGLDQLFSGLKFKDISTPQNFNAWLKATGKYDGKRNYPDYVAELKRQLSLALDRAKQQSGKWM